ncbi:hypothetical protein [Lysinibacillus sp. NPDC086135]|uniref:hypothetical protein n=1 Tax=Lysinibacillus sp. NPDC086135 TaxID=3364130 RepID=UPI003806ADD8
MAHYDYMYESFLLEDVEEELVKLNRLIESISSKRKVLKQDLNLVKGEYSKMVVDKELKVLNKEYDDYNKKLSRWNTIKDNIINGEKYNYIEAHDYVNKVY